MATRVITVRARKSSATGADPKIQTREELGKTGQVPTKRESNSQGGLITSTRHVNLPSLANSKDKRELPLPGNEPGETLSSHLTTESPCVGPKFMITPLRTTFQTSMPEPSTEAPPDQVKATYVTDLNILKIHEAIVARFASLRGSIPRLEAELAELRKKLEFRHWSVIEVEGIQDRIRHIESEIKDLSTGARWNRYIEAVKPILEAYVPLISDEVRGIVSIRVTRKVETDAKSENPEIVKERLKWIRLYLEKVTEQGCIRLDISWQGASISRCPGCGRPFSEIPVDEEVGTHECECGYERENLSKCSSFKDAMRVNVGGRNSYNDRETFVRAFARFEGTYPDVVPDLLYDQLDEYFTSKGFPKGEYFRALPLEANGRKAGTSVSLLNQALQATDNADFYKCYTLVGHHYWGWALRDFSKIYTRVMEEYDMTQEVYNVEKERDSSLNVNIRIYLHLKAVDYPCDWDDFKYLTARDSLEYHQRMWKKMCDQTGVKYTEII